MTNEPATHPPIDPLKHLGLASGVALRYRKWGRMLGMDEDDLKSEASFMLIKACRDYIPNPVYSFTNYAFKRISGHLFSVLKRTKQRSGDFFVQMATKDDGEQPEVSVCPTDQRVSAADARELLSLLMRAIDARKRQLLSWHYGTDGSFPLSIAKIAERMGMTREGCDQLKNRCLAELRRQAQRKGIDLAEALS